MEWEDIDSYHKRAKVPGGWVLKAFEHVVHITNGEHASPIAEGYDWRLAMVFIPDPFHQWRI